MVHNKGPDTPKLLKRLPHGGFLSSLKFLFLRPQLGAHLELSVLISWSVELQIIEICMSDDSHVPGGLNI